LISRLDNKKAAQKLFHDIAPRYVERPGGYLRITKQGKVRKRDGAKTARIEFV
jgi:large subunit ribosomal protein L17